MEISSMHTCGQIDIDSCMDKSLYITNDFFQCPSSSNGSICTIAGAIQANLNCGYIQMLQEFDMGIFNQDSCNSKKREHAVTTYPFQNQFDVRMKERISAADNDHEDACCGSLIDNFQYVRSLQFKPI